MEEQAPTSPGDPGAASVDVVSGARHVRRGGGASPPVGRAELIAVCAVVAAFLVGAVAAVRAGWWPIADEALVELRVRDVPAHLPLVGVYSRFGWNHPGPAQFWLLALPYRLGGASSVSLLVATMFGHLAAVLSAWWLARRIDLLAGWTVLISLMVVLASTPADVVRTPWNPSVALVAAGTFAVAAWAMAERDAWGVIGLVVLGTLLVQAHVVTLPVVAIVAAVAIAAAWWPRRDPSAAPIPWRAVRWSLLVLLVLWLGPLADLLVGDPSNSRLLRSDGDGPREGLAHGLGVLTREFAWWPEWARPSTVSQVLVETRPVVPVWWCLPIAGLVVALVRRDRRFVRGTAIAAAALLGIVATTTLLTGGLFNYLIVEYRSLVAVVMAIGAGAALQLVPVDRRRWVGVGAAVVVVGLAGVVGVRQFAGHNPQAGYGPTLRSLTDAVEAQTRADESFVVDSADDFQASELASGLILQLERAGHTVYADADDPRKFGRHRVAGAGEGDVELFVAPVDHAAGLEADGWSVLDVFEPMTRDDAERLDGLIAERDQLRTELAGTPTGRERDALYASIQSLTTRIDALEADHIPMLIAARPATDR